MPVARFEMPDGRIARFEVPEGTSPEEAQAQIEAMVAQQSAANDVPVEQEAPSPEVPEASLGEKAVGMLEAGATMASGAVAEPVAGIAGIVQSLNPMADPGAGAQAVADTRNALTYQPRTNEGRQNLESLGQTLKPVTDALQSVEQVSGDLGYKIAGPTGGAIGTALPTAAMELLGIGAGKYANKLKQVSRAVPDEQATSILKAGEKFGVPVMTTDIKPPKGYSGRFFQSVSEKLGAFGTGTARVSQQEAREAAVRGLAEVMDIDLDSPFASDMVKSLTNRVKTDLKKAGVVRTRAVSRLDPLGDVPLTKTKTALTEVISKERQLGKLADEGLISKLQDAVDSASGNFSQVQRIRSELIDDIKNAGGVNPGALPSKHSAKLQSIKSAMDKDMMTFARANDRQAASDWIRSNRAFADAYTNAKDTELRRILSSGEATPEKIMTVIRGGKPSELQRLAKTMGAKGREAAKKAIIQDALKESKFFEVDVNPNPNAFATAMNKANRQQAVKVFFSGEAKGEIDGLTRLLNATRRAQEGSALVKTGEQATSLILGGGAGAAILANPQVAIPMIAGASAIVKSYESRPFRNLLIKIANTQPGSTKELHLLEAAGLYVASGLQAAKEQPEPEQQTEETSP